MPDTSAWPFSLPGALPPGKTLPVDGGVGPSAVLLLEERGAPLPMAPFGPRRVTDEIGKDEVVRVGADPANTDPLDGEMHTGRPLSTLRRESGEEGGRPVP